MLFDLRGRGRRNTIKVVYVLLALLLGGGLVLFGIGGGGGISGGLLDAITEGSGGGDPGQERFIARERDAAVRTRANPSDAPAWAELTRARFSLASTGSNFDASTSAYTDAGKAKLQQASQSWERYLSLDPPPAQSSQLAGLMVQAYSPEGLDEPEKAVGAQEIIAEARPGPNTYAQLAAYAYAAGQKRKGDLAKAEALKRSPKDEREALKGELDSAAQQGSSGQDSTPGAVPSAVPTPTPAG